MNVIIEKIRERKAVVIVTSFVLLLALGSIWLRLGRSTLKLNHAEFRSIGQVVAEETARSIRGRGNVVAIINAGYEVPDTAQFDNWQGFRDELKKNGDIRLLATELVEADPADGGGTVGCPSDKFPKLLEKYAGAEAIVFFISFPDWLWVKQNNLIPEHKPEQIIVLDLVQPASDFYREYFARGLLSVLIGSRRNSQPLRATEAKAPREWFNQYFQVFTAANYEMPAE